MSETTVEHPVTDALLSELPEIRDLADRVASIIDLDVGSLTKRELLIVIRDVERLTRSLDAGMVRLIDGCDQSVSFVEDGHRSIKPCIQHLGRTSGREAHARTQTMRGLRLLPEVAQAYRSGSIPTEMVRAICRVAANPRVTPYLQIADPIFAELAAEQDHDSFIDWLKRWEQLADADGAAEATEASHSRRNTRVWTNSIDDTVTIESRHGAAQGAVIAEVFEQFVAAEYEADLAWAKENLGEDFALEDLPRTPAQRRADALYAIFVRAAAQPADAQTPEPLVNIVVDQETFETELARTVGKPVRSDPSRVDEVVCHTDTGRFVHPSDAIEAALIGHIRRIVVDASGTIIDLGRRRRTFTGSARDAALLQDVIAHRGATGCRWPGCGCPHRLLQIDHRHGWRNGGTTTPANAQTLCGIHNRLKETGYTPTRGPNGTWTIQRPDNTDTTPPG